MRPRREGGLLLVIDVQNDSCPGSDEVVTETAPEGAGRTDHRVAVLAASVVHDCDCTAAGTPTCLESER